MFRVRVLFAAALAAGLSAACAADDSKLKVKEGDKFPAIPLTAAQVEKVKPGGGELSIADLKGKTVVVFFYPKASTKGCTVESCGFRDISKDLPADAVLVGASADGMEAQKKFIDEHQLPMPLLCDTDKKLIKELGIEMAGRGVPQRVTFIVDKEGTIRKIYPKVDPATHPKEVLEAVKELSAKK